MSALFLWRGMWTIHNGGEVLSFYINSVAFLIFCAMAFVGLLRRNAVMTAITLLSVIAILLYATFSHSIPRFMAITVPNMIIALTLFIGWLAFWVGLGIQTLGLRLRTAAFSEDLRLAAPQAQERADENQSRQRSIPC